MKSRRSSLRSTGITCFSIATLYAFGCSDVVFDPLSDEGEDEALGALAQTLTKPNGVNGDEDYCNDPANRCDIGEGDCDAHSQCYRAGTVMRCGTNNGPKFGQPTGWDVCVPAACNNGVLDGTETSIDCGGNCGTQGPCAATPQCSGALGGDPYCSTCLCTTGQGDCDTNQECAVGNVCGNDNGPKFGFAASIDVCVPAHCQNGILDGGETEVDCGAGCGNCSSATDVAAGTAHACLITGGGVSCWGDNTYGQVGDGSTTDRVVPTSVPGVSGATKVAAGRWHSCALVAGGAVVCWGRGTEGQLGNGGATSSSAPVAVAGVTGATALSLGDNFSCALAAGTVSCWGDNTSGQSGNGSVGGMQLTPDTVMAGATGLAAGGRHACALEAAGTARCWGEGTNYALGNGSNSARGTPVAVSSLTGATQLTAGDAHTCALVGGSVYCWGLNAHLGTGATTTTVRVPSLVNGISAVSNVFAGWRHTCGIVSGGALRCWGRGDFGQLGTGSTLNEPAPVAVLGVSQVTVADAGQEFTCARSAGGVSCWGYNRDGQLGRGYGSLRLNPANITVPTPALLSANDATTCSATATGAVRCWGSNDAGQLGDGTIRQRRVATSVSGVSSTYVSAGAGHTCALAGGGAVNCWGDNTYGQLGNGTTTDSMAPTPVTGLTGAVELIAGIGYTCARTSAGAVLCWGRSNFGQVGNGGTADQLTPATIFASGATALTAGQRHTCAIVSGAISCWGRNQHGQVGDGSLTDRLVPTAVVGAPASAVELAAGQRHTCARTSAGAVSCWGTNANGQLGDGTTTDHLTPAAVSATLGSATRIAAGGFTTCAIISGTQAIKCWGGNNLGQVGDGTQIDRLVPVVVKGAATYSLLTMGSTHACARLTTGGVRCWGGNDYGQLGDATSTRFPEAQGVLF